MPDKKINRLVVYPTAQAYDEEAEYPKDNNTFIYLRAPEGYLYELVAMEASVGGSSTDDGVLELSDGRYYTGWNIFPGVENRETLARIEFNLYNYHYNVPLYNWECKEYTIGVRSTNTNQPFKICVIVWYYLKKASREELLEYAVKHPIREDTFKALLGQYSTVNQEEE